MGYRWGLAWQALPTSDEACWGPDGSPVLPTKGWVDLHFLPRPQLTHHSITFHTRNSHQDFQQAMDDLLSKGAIERILNETSLRFYSWLFLVPKKTGDLRPIINLSTLNWHLVVPHFKKGDPDIRSSNHQEPRMDCLHRHKR